VWAEALRLLEGPALVQTELERRLETARQAHPAQRRQETLNRDLARVHQSMERLLTAYQEDLLSLAELRWRMPALRQRELALQAEVQSLSPQFSDQAAYLRLAETLSAFFRWVREIQVGTGECAHPRYRRTAVYRAVAGQGSRRRF